MGSLSNRDRQAALENDKLQTAMRVIDTFDSMDARKQQLEMQRGQLEMQRGQMEAQRMLDAKRMASMDQEVAVAKAKLKNETDVANHTAVLYKGIGDIHPDDLDGYVKINTLRGGASLADPAAQRAAEVALARASALKDDLDKARDEYGLDPDKFAVKSWRQDPSTGAWLEARTLDRASFEKAKNVAEREVKGFRNNLGVGYQAIYDALRDRGQDYVGARQKLENHGKAEWYLADAADAGVPSWALDQARRSATFVVAANSGKDANGNRIPVANDPGTSNGDVLPGNSQVKIYDLDALNRAEIVDPKTGNASTFAAVYNKAAGNRDTRKEITASADAAIEAADAAVKVAKEMPPTSQDKNPLLLRQQQIIDAANGAKLKALGDDDASLQEAKDLLKATDKANRTATETLSNASAPVNEADKLAEKARRDAALAEEVKRKADEARANAKKVLSTNPAAIAGPIPGV